MKNISVIYQALKFNFSVFSKDKAVSHAGLQSVMIPALLCLQGQHEYD